MCRSNQKDGRGSEHVDFPSMLLRAYDMWSCDQGEQNQRKQRNWTSTESWIGGGKKKKKTEQMKVSSPPTPRQSWMWFIRVEAVVDLSSVPSRLGPHRGSQPAVGGIYHPQGIAEARIKGGRGGTEATS